MGWASLFAGGSCTAVPIKDTTLLRGIAEMKPARHDNAYWLESEQNVLLLKEKDGALQYNMPDKKSYILYKVDEKTGEIKMLQNIKSSCTIEGKGIFWIKRK